MKIPALRALLVLTDNWTWSPHPTPKDLVEIAAAAEAAAEDGVAMSDHMVLGAGGRARGLPFNLRDYAMPDNQEPDSSRFVADPHMVLAAVVARTSRRRLVIGVLISRFRHPLVTAKDLATLDPLSEDRLFVVSTMSWHDEEYAALGVTFLRRGTIMDEQLEIWRRSWSGPPSPSLPWSELFLS